MTPAWRNCWTGLQGSPRLVSTEPGGGSLVSVIFPAFSSCWFPPCLASQGEAFRCELLDPSLWITVGRCEANRRLYTLLYTQVTGWMQGLGKVTPDPKGP